MPALLMLLDGYSPSWTTGTSFNDWPNWPMAVLAHETITASLIALSLSLHLKKFSQSFILNVGICQPF